ncbi:MAG: A/G-specific adenine glycosylase [Gammaproteobacteria bacterium]|nr:MAG: A/G-specific adenine glycosylase [Gammaproteobacteria bacterium]UTW43901.1 A/G-specific adenine glycosylase [bacterium SCSIO 12844]
MSANKTFSDAIIHWQKQEGRHDLPWQKNITPYRVWLSETMLQQTQVKTVTPYFNSFIEQFPNITDLAYASDEIVMKLWAGLGYYSRARNLHKTAKIISNQYNAQFPDQFENIIQLPGIGRSTAGAILSLGFNKNYPILDGNVKRVFARVYELKTPINQTKSLKQLWQYAEELMPQNHASIYNQGLMDLGALVCTKNNPSCLICPINQFCQSFKNNSQLDYPKKAIKKPKPIKTLNFLVIETDNSIVLKKRPSQGIWGGLWSLPDNNDYPNLSDIEPYKISEDFTHQFTHFKLVYNFKYYKACNIKDNVSDQFININDLGKYAFPKPIMTFIEKEYAHSLK